MVNGHIRLTIKERGGTGDLLFKINGHIRFMVHD